MIGRFLRDYLELPKGEKSIVCLGGGVGSAQILKGLRSYEYELTAIVSMADDGGSAGRLRRAFSVPPPGDLVNCLAALSPEESLLKNLLMYRFSGERYGKDTDLGGQKLGNLIFVALTNIFKGNTQKALEELSQIISSKGKVLPATAGDVNIWARTANNKKIYGEQNIDLGKYNGNKTLKEVHLDPPDAPAYKATIEAIVSSNLLVIGPGDLFSTVLPVLIVPKIKKALNSKAKKVFIVNIANKPFETANFAVSDYLKIIKTHVPALEFDKILVNTNHSVSIPKGLKYKYVSYDKEKLGSYAHTIIEGDFVEVEKSIYHNSDKIAKAIVKLL